MLDFITAKGKGLTLANTYENAKNQNVVLRYTEVSEAQFEEYYNSLLSDFTVYHEPITDDEAPDNSGEAAPAPAPEAPKNDGKKGSKIALIIMGVLVVGIIVAIVLFKRYDKKTSGNNTTVVKNKDGQNAKNAKNVKNAKNGKKGKK